MIGGSMKTPGTLFFVLRWFSPQFSMGLLLLVSGALGLYSYEPDPIDLLPVQSLVGMLGPWPYLTGVALGCVNAGIAWRNGAWLRRGR